MQIVTRYISVCLLLSPINQIRKTSKWVEVFRLKIVGIRIQCVWAHCWRLTCLCIWMCMNVICHRRLIFSMIEREKDLKMEWRLTTNFLSWICKPFSRRIQRSVPSGFSYSQKPKAKREKFFMKREKKIVFIYLEVCHGHLELVSNWLHYHNATKIIVETKKMSMMIYLKHSFDHNIGCSIRNTTNKYCCNCL